MKECIGGNPCKFISFLESKWICECNVILKTSKNNIPYIENDCPFFLEIKEN